MVVDRFRRRPFVVVDRDRRVFLLVPRFGVDTSVDSVGSMDAISLSSRQRQPKLHTAVAVWQSIRNVDIVLAGRQ